MMSGVLELMEAEVEVSDRGYTYWQLIRQQSNHDEQIGQCHQIWQKIVIGPAYLNPLVTRIKGLYEPNSHCTKRLR